MSKKIALIALSTLVKDPFNRCLYMLSIIVFSILATSSCKPFLISNLNYLEYHSNCCSLIIIITSAFCLQENTNFLQTVFLIFSFYVNVSFIAKCGSSLTKVLIAKYQHALERWSPNFYIFCLAILQVNSKQYRRINKRLLCCCCRILQDIIIKKRSLQEQFTNGKLRISFKRGTHFLEPQIECKK